MKKIIFLAAFLLSLSLQAQLYADLSYHHTFINDSYFNNQPGFKGEVTYFIKSKFGISLKYIRVWGYREYYPPRNLDGLPEGMVVSYDTSVRYERRAIGLNLKYHLPHFHKGALTFISGVSFNNYGKKAFRTTVEIGTDETVESTYFYPGHGYSLKDKLSFLAGAEYEIPLNNIFSTITSASLEFSSLPDYHKKYGGCIPAHVFKTEFIGNINVGIRMDLLNLARRKDKQTKKVNPFFGKGKN